jgi:hypothetical protein
VLFGLVLAACGSPHSTTSAGTTTTAAAQDTPVTTVPGGTYVPYNKYKNARLDVGLDGPCTQNAKGVWVVKGIAHNPAPTAPTGFAIVIDFVHDPGGTVLETQIVQVPPVQPKQTVPWQASWAYSGSGVSCVIRQAQVT